MLENYIVNCDVFVCACLFSNLVFKNQSMEQKRGTGEKKK